MLCVCCETYTIKFFFPASSISLKSSILNDKTAVFLQPHHCLLVAFMIIKATRNIWISKPNSRTSHNNYAIFKKVLGFMCFLFLFFQVLDWLLVMPNIHWPCSLYSTNVGGITFYWKLISSVSKLLLPILGHPQSERKLWTKLGM